ncbi:hypothetical protein NEF87_002190 [Candidatus Lokiarchaeum ossiferum]|uniref:YCII-related domain-containing protein n=1 Tax=Candidatus Lokiarchaeum ossiferum TaxID=2951803 RepID=A0ABY6HR77_9ARCH|nr:hypothetical protein NEF87_002190 [Candidatus Lokiarchaeum sp. B-35]
MEAKQFIYVLKLRQDLLKDENWTKFDEKKVEEHFIRLKRDTEAGKVILAGRTLTDENPEGFGIVIFREDSIEKAREYMQEDPSVKSGVMTATLYPYKVALQSKN